ncbi:16S rRNA (cytosine(1402)-N(4))-methyltransferase RsmH [Candidatus Gottesmanbacteria bacterium]|nr:16S rRNA (cytosine(1402)-N(4))-methyltransferase RsmH [Candidatus Gottesmanbacteria bacterium]
MILPSNFHTPVLLPQVILALRIEKNKKYIDATLGGGGYADEILNLGGIVLGIDQDEDAIEYVKEKCKVHSAKCKINENLYLELGNFAELKSIADKFNFDKVAGIIFDLGMSSYQLEGSGRGFTYKEDEPLDMRMDKKSELTAGDIINKYSKERLHEIFTKYAEELHSRAVAEAIVRTRSLEGKILRTKDLLQLVESVLDRIYLQKNYFHKFKIYQSTKARIFQALRIEVNNEIENLQKGLLQAFNLLAIGGRIGVLSYHSLEDRTTKLIFRKMQNEGKLKSVNSNLIKAEKKEQQDNPKAKVAKLRVVERII